MDVITSFV
jgi:U4/U6 small nuclear ribonucleoprotein PRP3